MMRRADVVVVGAGPAGCAAAVVLARNGVRVILCGAQGRREKPCGGGLLPEAITALAALGVSVAEVRGRPVSGLRLTTAGGLEVAIPAAAAVVRRRDLDARLLEAAVGAGAEPCLGVALVGAEVDGGVVKAVRVASPAGQLELRGEAFVVATGASPAPRRLLGLGGTPRLAVALRGYARLEQNGGGEMLIALRRTAPPGYSWAFPTAAGEWNVGCGAFGEGSGDGAWLRRTLTTFAAVRGGSWMERPAGAALGTAYPRLGVARANVVAVGDAAGLARPGTGEGIGPALRSGVLAGECLSRWAGTRGAAQYRRCVAGAFASDQRAWRLGERLLAMPGLLDAMLRALRENPAAAKRVASVLSGTLPPRRVLSPLGLLRLYLGT